MLSFILLLAGPAGDLLETRLQAAIVGEGSLEATVRYRVELTVELDRIPFRFLEVDAAAVRDIEALEGERALPVTLEPRRSRQRRGYVQLSGPRRGALDVEIRYAVTGAVAHEGDELVARVPVAVLDVPQAEARAESFTAVLELPRGLEIVESFPSGLERAGTEYVGALPLAPAFVFLRAVPPGRLVSFERAVDWAVLALLAGLGAAGLRRGLRALAP